MSDVMLYRFWWYHGRRLRALREEHLSPLVERLVEEARYGRCSLACFCII